MQRIMEHVSTGIVDIVVYQIKDYFRNYKNIIYK